MSYIGNQPAESYASFEKQVFTIVNSQTAYTLTHAVTNENDIRLVVNNVVQEPGSGKAYTAANTTLTLSAALVNGTDEMYCVYLGRALQTVNPPAASVGNSQTAPTIITGQTAETSIATDDTILIHDTSASALRKMTRANFVSGIGGANTPAFVAYKNTSQTIANTTFTKVTFEGEQLDSSSAYDTSNSRFTPGVAGYYFIGSVWRYDTTTDFDDARFLLFRNGTSVIQSAVVNKDANGMTFSAIIYSDADDYFEMYARQDSGGNTDLNYHANYLGDSTQAQFYGFRIIGV